MSGHRILFKYFKPLKDGELTPKARKMAVNEVKSVNRRHQQD